MAKKAASKKDSKKPEPKASELKMGKGGKPLPAFLQGGIAKKAMKKGMKGC